MTVICRCAKPPGGAAIGKRFERFTAELPAICADAELEANELTFTEYADMASTWLQRELISRTR